MKIYGLYGKSGTGKSHKVQVLANMLGVSSIIDDGILIVEQVHVAGVSAKCERNLHWIGYTKLDRKNKGL